MRILGATTSAWNAGARPLTAALVGAALVVGVLGLGSPALASVQPPLVPMPIVSENFDAPLSSTRFAVGPYEVYGSPDPTAWWGRITNVSRGGTHSLYCAGASPTGNRWSIYPDDTRGSFVVDLPELAGFYSAELGLYYRMGSRGENDAESFMFQWRAKSDSTNWPLDSTDRSFPLTGTNWVHRSWPLASPDAGTNLSRTAGEARLLFVDKVGDAGESPSTGSGPAVDDLTVTGYKYGPVRDLAVTSPLPGTVNLTWTKPARATGTITADERTLTYRVWRKALGGATWTERTSARLATPGFTDTAVPGGTYTYLVQAWDTGTGAGYGLHETADVGVVGAPTSTLVIEHDAAGVTFDRFVTGYSPNYSGGGYVYGHGKWPGTKLRVRFTGSSITWYGPRQPVYGMADVYVDGIKQPGVADAYASDADKTLNAKLFEVTGLTDGPHTLEIRPKMRTATNGSIVVVDYFEVEGADPKGGGIRRDEMTGTLSGPWIKGTNSAYINKAYHYSRHRTASFTMRFTGTRIAWIGPKTSGYGRAQVWIDGVYQGVVSQYGTLGWRERVWESKTLPSGNHTITIRPTGTKDAASKGTIVVIDAFDVTP